MRKKSFGNHPGLSNMDFILFGYGLRQFKYYFPIKNVKNDTILIKLIPNYKISNEKD